MLLVQAAPSVGDILPYVMRSFDLWFGLYLVWGVVLLLSIRALDWYEREPVPVMVAMFFWGGIVATSFSAVMNTWIIYRLPEATAELYGAAIAAPLVEEIAKGAALAIAFGLSALLGKRLGVFEFTGVTDGIVYGAASGFGFAVFEDISYFVRVAVQGGSEAAGLENFLMRVDFAGVTGGVLGHGAYTALVGAGIGLAFWARSWAQKVAFVTVGLALAMFVHATWNGLDVFLLARQFGQDTVLAWFTTGVPSDLAAQMELALERNRTVTMTVHYALLAALVTAIVLWLRYEGRVIRFELAEEAALGTVTADEAATVTSPVVRTRAYLALLRSGRIDLLRAVRHLHDELVDLAMTKWRVRQLGGDAEKILQMREEVAATRGYAVALARIGTSSVGIPPSETDEQIVAPAGV